MEVKQRFEERININMDTYILLLSTIYCTSGFKYMHISFWSCYYCTQLYRWENQDGNGQVSCQRSQRHLVMEIQLGRLALESFSPHTEEQRVCAFTSYKQQLYPSPGWQGSYQISSQMSFLTVKALLFKEEFGKSYCPPYCLIFPWW